MIRVGLFRYIPHAAIHSFLARGWMVVADLGPVHGEWSVLGWGCECPTFNALNPLDGKPEAGWLRRDA